MDNHRHALKVLDLPYNASAQQICDALAILSQEYRPGSEHGGPRLFKLVMAAASIALSNVDTQRISVPQANTEYIRCEKCGPQWHTFVTASIFSFFYRCDTCKGISVLENTGDGQRNTISDNNRAYQAIFHEDPPGILTIPPHTSF